MDRGIIIVQWMVVWWSFNTTYTVEWGLMLDVIEYVRQSSRGEMEGLLCSDLGIRVHITYKIDTTYRGLHGVGIFS
jgi:hypothetical protein